MSSISQQNNFTTGQNVTATILNTEFSNIVTNINNIYDFIDDSTGTSVLLINENRLTMGTTTAAGAGDSAVVIDSEDYSDITAGDPLFTLQGDNGKESMMIKSYGTNQKNLYEGLSGRGTTASPSQTLIGDFLGGFAGGGINNVGAEARQKGFFSIKASENFTTTAQGTYAVISLTPTGTTARSESLTISVDGSSNVRLVPLGGTLNVTGNVNASNYVIAGYCQTNGFIGSGDKDCSGEFRPLVDNTYSNGNASRRWTAIWAVNGTIQTSDETTKQDIIDSDLGLDFINNLRPVAYKMKEAIKKVENEEGEFEYVEKEDNEKRTHYGLLADQVKEVLEDQDFAGYIDPSIGGEEGAKGLRYEEFIAPMIKGIQELTARVEELENQ